jgi:hypothetical protein
MIARAVYLSRQVSLLLKSFSSSGKDDSGSSISINFCNIYIEISETERKCLLLVVSSQDIKTLENTKSGTVVRFSLFVAFITASHLFYFNRTTLTRMSVSQIM